MPRIAWTQCSSFCEFSFNKQVEKPRARGVSFFLARHEAMKAEAGTYVLVMKNTAVEELRIGSHGLLEIKPGFYLYVGSAFGPGGVAARVGRHCRDDKKLRWHIDYLRQAVTVEEAWYSHSTKRLEHDWAHALSQLDGMETIPGFGSSDRPCPSHLFFNASWPEPRLLAVTTGCGIEISSFR